MSERRQPSAGVRDSAGARRADLAAIHIAKAALGWDDDTYRDVMATVCGGARSAGALDYARRKTWLAHLQACQRQAGLLPAEKARRAEWSPKLRKLWGRWQQLADAGLVRSRDRQALQEWATNQAGPSRLEWLTEPQIDMLLDRAAGWLKRGKTAPAGAAGA